MKTKLFAGALGALLALAATVLLPVHAADEVEVWKSPSCGCCGAWVDHLKANGFAVKVNDVNDVNRIKQSLGLSRELASCHTGLVNGYVIEGHVPASDIRRLLQEKPAVAGLAVPGMPMGSPGMEGPRKDSYQVLSFDGEGKTAVFTQY